MRVTLLPRASRTPACPGFCVFGDRKRSCFDRYCPYGEVSAEVGSLAPCGGCGRSVAEGRTHRGRMAGRGFERVQMGLRGDRICGKTRRVMSAWVPFERVQMDCGPGLEESRDKAPEMQGSYELCLLISFERVQMATALALEVALLGASLTAAAHSNTHSRRTPCRP
jgi:hypothetical protein